MAKKPTKNEVFLGPFLKQLRLNLPGENRQKDVAALVSGRRISRTQAFVPRLSPSLPPLRASSPSSSIGDLFHPKSIAAIEAGRLAPSAQTLFDMLYVLDSKEAMLFAFLLRLLDTSPTEKASPIERQTMLAAIAFSSVDFTPIPGDEAMNLPEMFSNYFKRTSFDPAPLVSIALRKTAGPGTSKPIESDAIESWKKDWIDAL